MAGTCLRKTPAKPCAERPQRKCSRQPFKPLDKHPPIQATTAATYNSLSVGYRTSSIPAASIDRVVRNNKEGKQEARIGPRDNTPGSEISARPIIGGSKKNGDHIFKTVADLSATWPIHTPHLARFVAV